MPSTERPSNGVITKKMTAAAMPRRKNINCLVLKSVRIFLFSIGNPTLLRFKEYYLIPRPPATTPIWVSVVPPMKRMIRVSQNCLEMGTSVQIP